MVIHPFWYICLTVRVALIFLVRYLDKIKQRKIAALLLSIMGIGFIYQAFSVLIRTPNLIKFFGTIPELLMDYFT